MDRLKYKCPKKEIKTSLLRPYFFRHLTNSFGFSVSDDHS